MNTLALHRAEVEFFREHRGEAFDEGAAKLTGDAEIAIESWELAGKEIMRLAHDHWAEIGDKGVPVAFDVEQYAKFSLESRLVIVTARDDGWLVGYDTGILITHLHHRTTTFCFGDITYLRPEYRKGMTGYKMMRTFRDEAKRRGAKRICVGASSKLPGVGAIFRRLGYRESMNLFEMVL